MTIGKQQMHTTIDCPTKKLEIYFIASTLVAGSVHSLSSYSQMKNIGSTNPRILPIGTESDPIVVAIALSLSPNQIVDTFEGPDMMKAHPQAATVCPNSNHANPLSSAPAMPILIQAPAAWQNEAM